MPVTRLVTGGVLVQPGRRAACAVVLLQPPPISATFANLVYQALLD